MAEALTTIVVSKINNEIIINKNMFEFIKEPFGNTDCIDNIGTTFVIVKYSCFIKTFFSFYSYSKSQNHRTKFKFEYIDNNRGKHIIYYINNPNVVLERLKRLIGNYNQIPIELNK